MNCVNRTIDLDTTNTLLLHLYLVCLGPPKKSEQSKIAKPAIDTRQIMGFVQQNVQCLLDEVCNNKVEVRIMKGARKAKAMQKVGLLLLPPPTSGRQKSLKRLF